MQVSEATVRTHLNVIYRRLGVSSRTAAVARVSPLPAVYRKAKPVPWRTLDGNPSHEPAELTGRQLQIMGMVRAGFSNAQIAERLEVSEGTVRTHLNNVYARLEVGSRAGAVHTLFGPAKRTAGS